MSAALEKFANTAYVVTGTHACAVSRKARSASIGGKKRIVVDQTRSDTRSDASFGLTDAQTVPKVKRVRGEQLRGHSQRTDDPLLEYDSDDNEDDSVRSTSRYSENYDGGDTPSEISRAEAQARGQLEDLLVPNTSEYADEGHVYFPPTYDRQTFETVPPPVSAINEESEILNAPSQTQAQPAPRIENTKMPLSPEAKFFFAHLIIAIILGALLITCLFLGIYFAAGAIAISLIVAASLAVITAVTYFITAYKAKKIFDVLSGQFSNNPKVKKATITFCLSSILCASGVLLPFGLGLWAYSSWKSKRRTDSQQMN